MATISLASGNNNLVDGDKLLIDQCVFDDKGALRSFHAAFSTKGGVVIHRYFILKHDGEEDWLTKALAGAGGALGLVAGAILGASAGPVLGSVGVGTAAAAGGAMTGAAIAKTIKEFLAAKDTEGYHDAKTGAFEPALKIIYYKKDVDFSPKT